MRVKRKAEEKPADTFTVLFASFSIILLAFFIMLNSIAVVDEQRTRKALSSLVGTFGVPGGRIPLTMGLTPPDDAEVLETVERWMSKWKERSGITVQEALRAVIAANGMDEDVEVTQDGSDLRITFREQVAFAPGTTQLRDAAKNVLTVAAAIVRSLDSEMEMVGHTSLEAAEGGLGEKAWELSTYRAASVARYMIDEEAIPADRVSVRGRAAYHPAASNDDPEGRSQNRRVELLLKRTQPSSTLATAMDFWKRFGARNPFPQPTSSDLEEEGAP
ncbi:MAG: OmpA family protein [Deltaproteobacteria bacterium]|nr:OmpA family protein [Deltaproteobacteria bacterium]